MKKLISILVILFCNSTFATTSDIVVLVNDRPITKYDISSRKNMIVALNNIDNSDPAVDAKLNSGVTNLLIEEELLNQYAENHDIEVSSDQVNDAIRSIEEANNMSSGGLREYIAERGVPIEYLKKQIKGDIIKRIIISSISNSVSVSQLELNAAIINDTKPEFNVEAWIFTSKGRNAEEQKQMQHLKKKLYDCNNIDPKLYEDFAEAQKINRKLGEMSPSTISIIHDTKAGSTSNIYKEGDKFKLVFVCKKQSNVSANDLDKIKNFLSNKKMSQKAIKFLKDLRTRADIKIMSSS